MRLSTLALLFTTSAAVVSATLDPCTTNTKNKIPTKPACTAKTSSSKIQAAECSHNTRLSAQTFAVWTLTKTNSNGIEYGTCEAYSCAAPVSSGMKTEDGTWTFFWSGTGEQDGVGTGCIKDPNTTQCGCENSDGEFVVGSDACF